MYTRNAYPDNHMMMNWQEHFLKLSIETPTLSLRVADKNLIEELGNLAANDITVSQANDSPFRSKWDRIASQERNKFIVNRQYEAWNNFNITKWKIPLTVCLGVSPIGEVTLHAQDFHENKTFSTTSWLGESFRGKGYGVEIRAAALQFGFGALSAERALSASFANNEKAIAITRCLSYKLSGATMFVDGKEPVRRILHHRLDRRMWESRIRRSDISISEMCVHFP